MVEAVGRGDSQRLVAARSGVGRGTVQRALARVGEAPLEEVTWTDRPTAPRRTRRTDSAIEQRVAEVRAELHEGVLGDHGAVAIARALRAAGDEHIPSVRTIGRIIERTGLTERRRRIRRPAPPPGWYLPGVAAGEAELDEFDAIVDLPVFAHGHLDVLTAISLHGGDPDAWPARSISARLTCDALGERWRRIGLPAFAQFDNDTRFLGTHARPDILGAVPLFALAHGVTPVFAPLREMGFQAAIEGFNGRWQRRVYRRSFGFDPPAIAELSGRFLAAVRVARAARIEGAPARRPWPEEPGTRAGRGRLVFLRRTTAGGEIDVLGRLYRVDGAWPLRLVRAELDLDGLVIRCFALRRRDPSYRRASPRCPMPSPPDAPGWPACIDLSLPATARRRPACIGTHPFR